MPLFDWLVDSLLCYEDIFMRNNKNGKKEKFVQHIIGLDINSWKDSELKSLVLIFS